MVNHNEYLPQLENKEVIASVVNNLEHYSRIVKHIKRYEIDGDKISIIGLASYEPKGLEWSYKNEDFRPEEVVKYTVQIEKKDKKIFYTVYSEDVEKLALNPQLVASTLAKQADQVGYDAALYTDKILIEEICKADNYANDAKTEIKKLSLIKTNDDLKTIADEILTTALKMTAPSTVFNKKGTKVKIIDTKDLNLYLSNELYTKFRIGLTGVNTSISFEEFKKDYNAVINENLLNNVAWALTDKQALGIGIAINKRALVYDGYVNCHKILDHLWEKPLFVDYRPAFLATFKTA